ncbi:MAG: glycoside hydrolase 43 family protein [Bacteroidales bacterium]|nr:glycoside hydrolase 43 family protein [Bacteroidales bacterium]
MKQIIKILCATLSLVFFNQVEAQNPKDMSKAWVPDNGDGTYTNPVLYADYSDPDAIRVGDDYFMVASSFNCVPGLPILHSFDLVNWELIGYALPRLQPFDIFDKVQHGKGVWAPCIRFHKNEYYIFYPDPDFGIYRIKASNPAGPWSEPILVQSGKGLIDPAPLWDDDGKAYLVYALAGSRASVKSVILISRMNVEGSQLVGNPVLLFDGHKNHPTVEGPKIYKRNGYFYIFAPAGGVSAGWQVVLRSKHILGPYEAKVVMAQGKTDINGPHQGAWVDTKTGENWFLNFQDLGAYGRVVHLNPMKWVNNWPVIGTDADGDGIGEPVRTYKKPNVGKARSSVTPPESDEFNTPELGLQWQWQANYQTTWGYPSGNLGFFRLNCIPRPDDAVNLWDVSNLLIQKFPAPEFTATAKFTFDARFDGEEVGLVVMGTDYGTISLKRNKTKLEIQTTVCNQADKAAKAEVIETKPAVSSTIYFRVRVSKGADCQFSYSTDGVNYTKIGNSFKASEGKWIGAKLGFFALSNSVVNDAGSADIDWFRVTK